MLRVSSRVFHALHSGHWPLHLLNACPHASHWYCVALLIEVLMLKMNVECVVMRTKNQFLCALIIRYLVSLWVECAQYAQSYLACVLFQLDAHQLKQKFPFLGWSLNALKLDH